MSDTTHPVYVDRIHHLIALNIGTESEKNEWSKDVIDYMSRIQCFKTPYLNDFLEKYDRAKDVNDLVKTSMRCEDEWKEKVISHDYNGAISLLESRFSNSTSIYRKFELIAELYLLDKKFMQVEELEYRVCCSIINYDEIQKEEFDSYRKIRLILLASYWHQGRFSDCSITFFKFIEEDQGFLTFISEIEDVKAAECKTLLLKEEIIMYVVISTIVYIPINKYDVFLYLEDINELFKVFPLLRTCLQLLVKTRFNEFLKIWNSNIKEIFESSVFLYNSWHSVDFIMTSKLLFFYLRMSNQITINYLSETLGLEYGIVREQLTQLIEAGKLNFEITGDDVIFKPRHHFEDIILELNKNYEDINDILKKRNEKTGSVKQSIQDIISDNYNSTLSNTTTNDH
ncbi:hypothetical protein TPHA_0J01030 [Tetrapisispora phaffii CBS 4417]|uniref:PCI domain-containing protein n=1 Tax=Tetrapisispora phaffii (strain ATCC 24235 / CBS 4417 / NBRC 1672 / NRRL Y-8282 / UCD 70-5) TaxID=1071381 RepID=G8BYI3_TETPH|nr:hypothetical protein TPHA_0J01030 [Tetrapisispora phaffii CBS 4417]CCE64925.1 hypothetical protein TPHA_0J01030 [Tetrapisispora phaffii CBS 4417]